MGYKIYIYIKKRKKGKGKIYIIKKRENKKDEKFLGERNFHVREVSLPGSTEVRDQN
jgi:hypothetical protein